MAIRTKTIEFCAQSTATVVAAAANVDRVITVYIPETVVAFRSVALQCTVRGANTATGNLTSPTLGIGLAAVAIEESAASNPIANSGDSEAWTFARECSSYFATNWSGSSMTATLRFRGSTISTACHGFKLLITYDYDDDETTQIKTIRWPIESTRVTLGTSYQTVGGATAIPAFLHSVTPELPEAGVVIRQAFVELWGNEAQASGTTDWTLSARVNGGAASNLWFSEQFATSSTLLHVLHDISGEAFTSAVAYEMITTSSSRAGEVGGFIVVTYEFQEPTTTVVLNSIVTGAFDTAGSIGGNNNAADNDRWSRDILIEEPGPITLQPSAVLLVAQDSAGYTLNVRVGAQSYQGYTMNGASVVGGCTLVHRVDAAGEAGASGFASFGRGRVSYVIDVYSGTNLAGWNLSGVLVLNYRSGKAPAGIGAHAHTVYTLISPPVNNGVSYLIPSARAANYYEAENGAPHWLMALVVAATYTTDNSSSGSVVFNAERAAGEFDGDGWEPVYVGTNRASNENTNMWIFSAGRSLWRRHPGDPEPRFDPYASRRWRFDGTPAAWASMFSLTTYHAITATVSGTVSGYVGDGSGIPVVLYRASDHEVLAETTTSAGGSFAFDWYDDTEPVYVAARESDTRVGRSGDAVAGS